MAFKKKEVVNILDNQTGLIKQVHAWHVKYTR